MGDDVEEKYTKELLALKINSKPLINSLTMMAEDFILSAPVIVQVIEKHLARVRPEAKLPILYLIDSIVKNIKKEYIELFSQNIVATFCGVFELVEDRNVRGNLFKLRQTWVDVFPTKKLMAIDLRCSDLDEKWPIGFGLNASSTIHVNPKFLPSGQLRNSNMVLPYDTTISLETTSPTEVELRKQFLMKQKQLLELQEKKIELELLEKQFNMEEQARKKKQQEEQANAKLLGISAQAELAKQKTQTATSIIARSNVTQPQPAKEMSETPAVTSPPQTSEPHKVLRNPPEVVERVSRNPDLYPSDPRLRRTVILQTQHPQPLPMQPWNSKGISPVKLVPRKPAPMHDHPSVEVISINSPKRLSTSPTPSSPLAPRRSNSRSPKEEKTISSEKSRGSSKESQGSGSGRRSGGEDKRSPLRFTFPIDGPTSPLLSSPGNRSQSPKRRDGDRTERKRSRASSKSSTNSRRGGAGSEKDVSLRSSREKEIKLTPETPKKSGDKNRRMEDRYRDKFERKPSSNVLPSPTKKQRRVDEHRPKPKKGTAESFRFDNVNSKNGSSKGVRADKSSSGTITEEKKGRRVKEERNSGAELNVRNETRKAEREKRETERDEFKRRTSAVLERNYRKRPGIAELEEEEGRKTAPGASDIDQRFENKGDKDVDLRKPSILEPSELSEPPSAKKSRTSTFIDNLFGREDIDWRPPSGSWSQVKKPNEDERLNSIEGSEVTPNDEQLKDMLLDGKQRPPPPVSPASSVGSTAASTCDALGRPLAFARLPDDPEERRRSLGSRSLSIDPVDTFRQRYIETPMKVKGILDASDLAAALSRCKNEFDQGILNNAQFNIISKQLVQLNEGIKIRKVQEMDTTVRPGSGHLPNPWNPESNPVWAVGIPGFPRGPPMGVARPEGGMWARGAPPIIMPRGPNPFVEASNPVPDILIPSVNQRELSLLELDIDGTTPLDKVPRHVRFYGNTAIVFVGKLSDEPKEISFIPEKDVMRTLFINGEPIKIRWGITRKFYYDNNSHNICIGAPTRELIIDGIGYEVYFGGQHTRIRVDNQWVNFRLAGPPPGVKIGDVLRYDLVAGRTTVFIDGNPYSLFLDEKPQILDFGGFPVISTFCDEFRSITFNGRSFPTLFGGPPRPVTLPNGRRLYIRFNAISRSTEQNIMTWIRIRAQQTGQGGGVRFQKAGPYLPGFGHNLLQQLPHQAAQDLQSSSNPLDMVANFLPPTESQPGVLDNSYEVELPDSKENDVTKTEEEPSSGPLNVQDLLSKLLLAGLLPSGGQSTPEREATSVEDKDEQIKVEKAPEIAGETKDVKPVILQTVPAAVPIDVVTVKFTDNLRKRRPKLIDTLYLGLQCGSCGLRFPTDQNYRYTQHLDWHFRQNRREKANARKALSRRWYFDISDWIQFEEVEDLEDRATSVFDTQELEMEEDNSGGARVLDPDSYTVLAAGFGGSVCPQCGEGFETFYDEEKEEWRLRDALQEPTVAEGVDGEKKLFHPICHQDYLHSLVEEDEPKTEEPTPTSPHPPVDDDDEVLILREGPKEVVLAEVDIAEDDESKVVKEKVDAVACSDSPMALDVAKSSGDDDVLVPAQKPNASYTVLSPVVIDVMEDENSNIPGIATTGGLEKSIFGFALNSDSSHSGTTPADGAEESRPPVVYEAMRFDFPKIKEEPVEWKEIAEDQIIMSSLFPHMSAGAEPMNITLDDEDSGIDAHPSSSLETPTSSQPLTIPDIDLTEDDAESTPSSQRPVVAEIDGNVQFRVTQVVPSAPSKIKINIFGLDTSSQSPTHKSAVSEDSPAPSVGGSLKPTLSVVPATDRPQSPLPLDLESLFKSDEIRRLKPKLAGKKFVNNPVKRTGKEESGLCSIV